MKLYGRQLQVKAFKTACGLIHFDFLVNEVSQLRTGMS